MSAAVNQKIEERPETTALGARLRQLRGGNGLSLGALATRSGLHKTTLSRWESGEVRPGIPELEAVLIALRASPEERHSLLSMLGSSGRAPRALRRLRDDRRQAAQTAKLPGELLKDFESGDGNGALLRTLRIRRRWSQETLAAHLNIHASALSRWERGSAWPEPERLQTLCFLLEATSEERATLMTRQIGPGSGPGAAEAVDAAAAAAAEVPLDRLEHHFRAHLAPLLLIGEMQPALDLPFVRIEAALWPHVTRRASVRPLLGEVYAHHANYLRNRKRFAECGSYAEKALALADGSAIGPLPAWVENAAVCEADAADRGGKRLNPRHAESVLRWWLTRRAVSAPNAAWMLRKLSGYQCAQGRFGDAVASLQASARLSKSIRRCAADAANNSASADSSCNVNSDVEVRRYMVWTLLAAGRVAEAQRWLPEVAEPYPANRVRDALLWAETMLRLGRPSVAHDWTERAFAEIAAQGPGLAHRRPDVERFAARL